jgi:hypothetical protein
MQGVPLSVGERGYLLIFAATSIAYSLLAPSSIESKIVEDNQLVS